MNNLHGGYIKTLYTFIDYFESPQLTYPTYPIQVVQLIRVHRGLLIHAFDEMPELQRIHFFLPGDL